MMVPAYKYFHGPIESLSTEVEDRFLAGIRLANKTFKTTTSGRMRDVDALVVDLVRGRGWIEPKVLDVGVSSAVTTFDLLDTMRAHGMKPEITATDLTIYASIFEIAPGIRILVDRAGNALQYELLGFGVRAWSRRLDIVTSHRLLTGIARAIAARSSMSPLTGVKLVSRLRMLSANNAVHVVEDDLFKPNPQFNEKFDVIRAANIVNLAYFPEPKLRAMLDNLKAYTRTPGGLIVVNRTNDDGTNHATVFETAADGAIRVVGRIGSGSEVEPLALT